MRTHKYNAKPAVVDGIKFPSRREAARYSELKLLERAGRIQNLRLQVRYPLTINNQSCGHYVSDFNYVENGQEIVEDVKGFVTDVFRLKKKLMRAIHGIEVREVC